MDLGLVAPITFKVAFLVPIDDVTAVPQGGIGQGWWSLNDEMAPSQEQEEVYRTLWDRGCRGQGRDE